MKSKIISSKSNKSQQNLKLHEISNLSRIPAV